MAREYCDRAILIDKSEIIAEGNPREVSTKYTRLFETEDTDNENDPEGKRWGDKSISFKDVKLTPQKVDEDVKELTLNITAVANKDIDHKSVMGFHINRNDGVMVQGANTKMQGYVIKELSKGDEVTVSWKIPNIFEDGKHYIGVSLVSSDFAHTHDWWEEAVSFRSYRDERTSFAVSPANVEIDTSKTQKTWEKV